MTGEEWGLILTGILIGMLIMTIMRR